MKYLLRIVKAIGAILLSIGILSFIPLFLAGGIRSIPIRNLVYSIIITLIGYFFNPFLSSRIERRLPESVENSGAPGQTAKTTRNVSQMIVGVVVIIMAFPVGIIGFLLSFGSSVTPYVLGLIGFFGCILVGAWLFLTSAKAST